MKNLTLYVMTVCAYFVAYAAMAHPQAVPPWTITDLKVLGLIALLALPVNIGGYVFTVIGNCVSEKSIYSLCSLYQKTNWNAFTLIGLGGYQHAGWRAMTCFGFSLYQQAARDAILVGGLSVYQEATNEAATLIGLAGYQDARTAWTFAGIAIYQAAGGKERAFGAFTALKAE